MIGQETGNTVGCDVRSKKFKGSSNAMKTDVAGSLVRDIENQHKDIEIHPLATVMTVPP